MPLEPKHKCNSLWRVHRKRGTITLARAPLFGRGDRFFLMGSCFAEEIRLALEKVLAPRAVMPDFSTLEFDPARARADELPGRNHLNYYNAFTILQELRRAVGLWTQDPDDFWRLDEGVQDPYRRLIIAATREELVDINAQLDGIIARAFAEADHFVFTFGLTEVFVNTRTGLVAAQRPDYGGGGGRAETEFRRSTFAENYAAVEEISRIIARQKPSARIFMTVSPVPLQRTFSSDDVFTANMLSKSTLRAVLGEAAERLDNVVYIPSYEAVMSGGRDSFKDDYRHVRGEVVRQITDSFVGAFMAADG
jgi:hypothetical protein